MFLCENIRNWLAKLKIDMTLEQLKQLITDLGYENVTVFENYDYADAFIGMSNDGRAVYSYDKMIEWLMLKENWTYEEAVEWIDYNTMRALPYYPDGPIVVYDVPEYMKDDYDKEEETGEDKTEDETEIH